MKMEAVQKIADAVLYEGHLLYPYRASALKNRKRWNFGVLVPESCQSCHELLHLSSLRDAADFMLSAATRYFNANDAFHASGG